MAKILFVRNHNSNLEEMRLRLRRETCELIIQQSGWTLNSSLKSRQPHAKLQRKLLWWNHFLIKAVVVMGKVEGFVDAIFA